MNTQENVQLSDRFGFASFISGGKWTPARSGNYGEDCQRGRAIGAQLIETVREHANPALFGSVFRMAAASGQWGAVEAGLFSAIGVALIQGDRANA